ncbi:MAG: hypothetical protein JNM17_24125 [Archangium sp.]|nr:hypothetical protein [Archangium sp.]
MVEKLKGGIGDAVAAAAKAAAKAAAEAAAKAAAKAAEAAAKKAAAGAAKAGEGFDTAKKKPLSMTGKFKPVGQPVTGNALLKDDVSSARLVAQAGGGTVSKPVNMTAGPAGVNKTDDPRPSASGKISQKEWDNPALLLGKLTQNPASGADANSRERCGPSNVLGAALMQGPESAAKYLKNVADAPKNNRLSDAEKKELKEIAGRIENKTATFEDLGRAQDLTYKAGNRVRDVGSTADEALKSGKLSTAEQSELKTLLGSEPTDEKLARANELLTKGTGHPTRIVKDPDFPGSFLATVEGSRSASDKSAYTDREVMELAEIGGTKQGFEKMDDKTLKDIFKDLKPGESAIIRVSGDNEGTDADHFVTIGKRKDGTAFIYNPDPFKGDPTVFVGAKGDKQSAAFMKELAKYENRTAIDPNGNAPRVTRLKID